MPAPSSGRGNFGADLMLRSPLLWMTVLFLALLFGMPALAPVFEWTFPGVEPPVFSRDSFSALFLSHAGIVADASLAAAAVGVGLAVFVDPPGRARFPRDRRCAGDGRPDLSAGCGIGAGGAGARLRSAADDRRAVALRPAADIESAIDRPRRRAGAGARCRRRAWGCRPGRACAISNCRWPRRRSSPGCGCR